MAQEAEVVEFAMDLKISPCQRNALLFRPGDDVPLNQFVPQKDRSPEDPLRRPGADDFLPRR
jgi:hypothetical protein